MRQHIITDMGNQSDKFLSLEYFNQGLETCDDSFWDHNILNNAKKFLLENRTVICYFNFSSRLPQYDLCVKSDPITYWDTACYGTQF